ncbi:MAG TPA: GDSL-type esterase/lipase family protein [Planctomycetota bacterium]|nr:GDSL-type esterase/lipase family protein [Planctomycetota bacterium]
MSVLVALALLAQNDKAQANGYDDAWENAWVTRCRVVYNGGSGKNDGMVLQIGDSITYSNPYGQWPRNGAGKTAEDNAVTVWCGANTTFPAGLDATSTNGFYLCAVDVPSSNRSMTAASGITAAEYLSGAGNGATPMPSTTDTATARGYVTSSSYGGNLHITTVAAAFANARFAVVMLGTNDAGANRPAADVANDLGAIIDVLEGRNIVVILSTIPPRADRDVTQINAQIRSLAQTRGLPLIDYYAEILARRSGTSWQGTLIGADGVHPTSVNSAADAYAGGDATAHRTGTNATNDGYLLRGWLTMQKLKEVKAYVVDGANPPGAPPPGPPAPPAVGSSRDNDNGDGCSCGTIRARLPWVLGLLGLPLLLRRR